MTHPRMGNTIAESKQDALRVEFAGQVRLDFHSAKATSDAGLPAYRELDETLDLTAPAGWSRFLNPGDVVARG